MTTLNQHHINTDDPNTITWSDYARMLIQQHYQQITQQQPQVLADRDPEPLHKMRVGLRRLRVTLNTFGNALNLPIQQENRALRKLGRKLGKLCDLDVQIATLKQTYRPLLPKAERKALDRFLKHLKQRRKKVLKKPAGRCAIAPTNNSKRPTSNGWSSQAPPLLPPVRR